MQKTIFTFRHYLEVGEHAYCEGHTTRLVQTGVRLDFFFFYDLKFQIVLGAVKSNMN